MLNFQANIFGVGASTVATFITLLVLLYSFKFMEKFSRRAEYYTYVLITLGAAVGVFFARDFITLMFFWGISAVTLYLLVGLGRPASGAAAVKTFVIVGGSDALMIFGLGIILAVAGNAPIGLAKLPLNNIYFILAFLGLLVGALAKAGAVPLHTWIPAAAEAAPVPVMALLPAALDKLLGIYLLFRLCTDVFVIYPNSGPAVFLMALGALTIIIGVMAALVQHNFKKLLSYHAVSQVGYMILGIGTGVPVAVAGGIFHMLNNAIYKSLLFLGSGAVEKKTGTTELDELGGLAKMMPITFGTVLIAALSISGVPPFNGFFSKWMIYQGIVELAQSSPFWIIWLLAAMFGSALTLASFIKVIHAVFLGQGSGKKAAEVHWTMWLPMVVLAAVCIIFGLFAFALPLPYFVALVVPGLQFSGLWNPLTATVLLIIGLLIGAALYTLIGRSNLLTAKPVFIGGESWPEADVKMEGTEFYNTIREANLLPGVYRAAETQAFDLYVIGGKATGFCAGLVSRLHNGLLQNYVAWLLLGAAVLVWILIR